ncbi:ARM repeat superfamily protein [Euphorbia peplus]|nr:ARM repeat superfamily protein [Euphorbia peplus]
MKPLKLGYWEEAFLKFETRITSGSEITRLNALINLFHLSKQAPNDPLLKTLPPLAHLLDSPDSPDPIREASAFCLNRIASKGDTFLVSGIVQSGALISALTLLSTRTNNNFHRVLIKFIRVLVNFDVGCRSTIARNGGLEIILGLLNSCPERDKLYLLEILSALALLSEVRRVLPRLRGLRFLVEAVRCGNFKSRERAAQAIGLLGVNERARSMLVALGVIPVLVELLREGDCAAKLVAGNSLGVISAHVDFIRPVAEAGAIALYAELLRGSDQTGKEIAEDVFCILAVVEENAVAIAEHLVQILREGDDEVKAAASDVIWNLSGYKYSISVVRNSGAIPVLVELLRGANGDVRRSVAGAISQLSYNEADRVALVDAGAVSILVELLHNDELEEEKDYAVEALVNFGEDPLQRSIIFEAIDGTLFQNMQNRMARLHVSDEQLARSLRRMSAQTLTWDPIFS